MMFGSDRGSSVPRQDEGVILLMFYERPSDYGTGCSPRSP